MRDRCAVLDWAASGAMALTGMPGGPPVASPAPVLAMLAQVTEEFARVTGDSGTTVNADPAELIAGRAALAGLTRGGRVSAGGSSFLLRAADGWCAVTVSRPDDMAAVPAIAGALGQAGASGDAVETRAQARAALAAAAAGTPAEEFAAAAQLVGVPAAALPSSALASSALDARVRPPAPGEASPAGAAGWPPWRTTRIAAPAAGATLTGAVVADLSSMWAGPLCSRLLGLAGAKVIKVESPARPDGARSGNREFFDWLHAGHRSLSVDFGTRAGQTALAALLEVADVVIEASRPRALAAAGLAPEMIAHRPGQVWLSITGYGRSMPERVAFGDDAAVAGGLVGWTTIGGYGGSSPRETGRVARPIRWRVLPSGAQPGEYGGSSPREIFASGAPDTMALSAIGRRAHGQSSPEPVFCADAIADPLTGACGALAVALSLSAGGGELIDLSMREVAGAFATATLDHGPHEVLPGGSVACPRLRREQAVLPPRRPALPAGPEAHAPELGADTSAVLAWLARRTPAC